MLSLMSGVNDTQDNVTVKEVSMDQSEFSIVIYLTNHSSVHIVSLPIKAYSIMF